MIKKYPVIFRIKHFIWLLVKRYNTNKNRYDYIISPYTSLSLKNVSSVDETVISQTGDNLYLTTRDYYSPKINIQIGNKCKLIGIESWKKNVVKLRPIKVENKRPLLKTDSYCIFWENGFLYKEDSQSTQELTQYILDDFMYCDMIHQGNWFALRSGGRIDVSKNLKDWKTVYKGKRGIKDSMVFVEKGDELSLLFIEYTPGTVRERHNILKYNFQKEELIVVKTFYTLSEYKKDGCFPCARHIHVIAKDPYTNNIYVSTGDYEEESGIHISYDNGLTYKTELFGAQDYRALSFIFTERYVFWNTDTHESQALIRMDKETKEIKRYALLNGALWCSVLYPKPLFNTKFYIMSSNSEGALYDNNNRVYGIILEKDEPIVFELLKKRSRTQYSQQFVLGFDFQNNVFFYDTDRLEVVSYRLEFN